MVTIEKWHGQNAVDAGGQPVFLWEEDAMIAAARQIKARDPSIVVLVWFDSQMIYTGWSWPHKLPHGVVNHSLNRDAKGGCATGHLRAAEFLETHSDYLLKNSSGLPALADQTGDSQCHIYDYARPEAQAFWRDHCLNMTRSGVIDGCGADFSDTDGLQTTRTNATRWGLTPGAAIAYDAGRAAMLRTTTAALGAGVLLGKTSGELLRHDPYVTSAAPTQECQPNNRSITSQRAVAALSREVGARRIYECHYACFNNTPPPGTRTDCIDEAASFLIAAGEYHYFLTGGWHDSKLDAGNFTTH